MTTRPQQQKDDEISAIDILLFLKASGLNVLLSTVVCFTASAAYYFAVPKIYEASATIKTTTVAGELTEPPAVLLEKIKLPMFFSMATLQACGTDGELSTHSKFIDKIKPTLHKSAPFISISARAQSTQEARACLEAVIGEIEKSQNEIAKTFIDQKKQKLAQLIYQLKLLEVAAKSIPTLKVPSNISDPQLLAYTMLLSTSFANSREIVELRKQILDLETDLSYPQTQLLSLASRIYAPEVSINKRPLYTLWLTLALGVFLGLLVTGVMRVVPKIRRDMQVAELS